ncbi:MAG: hypothetical protein AW11_02184 [Candidatus Accumulibacter regalis]|jgi:hypothetical protein|uniref:Transmembrane protein n=1 Tax=Accumulibacter regalis TaxID=522306 RepID=A0A011P006_ACCRE|nr:hypothetical protein [Accumulibacter sp.]EXI88298.1 MAG: hypothetical protein AW11_02184 [Candidatus Accumulibacter regalis]HRE71200.1 hypothetical protein [Accumulibacter sp.]HRE85805.1 hypothetical protein [Accumulibacter sp.]
MPPGNACPNRESGVDYGTIALAALLQFFLVAYSFPLAELFSQTPVLFSDAGYHWYHMKLALALARDGTQWAYDPFFAAGLPRGVFLDPSAHFPAALAALFSPAISEAVLYKIYAFASALLAPLSVLLAARLLDLPKRQAIVAMVFAMLLFWTSMFRWYYTHGMVSFVTAAYLALPFAALFFRYTCGRGGGWLLGGTGAFGALAFFYHPLFPVLAASLIGPWLIVSFRLTVWRRVLAALTVIPLLSLLPNLPWLDAVQEYSKAFPVGDFMAAYQAKVDPSKLWMELLAQGEGCKAYAPIALLALWAAIKEKGPAARPLAISFLSAAIILLVFAAVGAALRPLASLQPNRFAAAGYLFLTIPAAFGFMRVWQALRSPTPALRATAVLTAIMVAISTSYAAYEVAREVSYADIGHVGKKPPMVDGAGPYTVWLEDWLRQHTEESSRILFEVSLPRLYDGGRVTGYLALRTKREFIGGPYPYMHAASFQDGQAFGKALGDLPSDLFATYLGLYNVGWIVANTATNKDYIDALPGVDAVANNGSFRIYRVRGHDANFFLKGQGTISHREHNRVVATNVSGPAIVLKYHYHERLQIDPPARMYPVQSDLDPIPFIGIDDPPAEFTISIR